MDALRCECERKAETQPADEGVATASQPEEPGDGLVREGWLGRTGAGLWDVAVEDVEPGRGGRDWMCVCGHH